jgi:hypothetical protein
MFELSMPVKIFRGRHELGVGDLLPNGDGLALCPEDDGLQLLDYEADTKLVEEKIPLTVYKDSKEVTRGELYQSGTNICLSPEQSGTELLDPDARALLVVDPSGLSARLDITSNDNCGHA